MDEVPLHLSYDVCGKTFPITTKTALYQQSGMRYEFRAGDGPDDRFYLEVDGDLEQTIGLRDRDRVTMCMFAGSNTFMVFNHRTAQARWYPDGVRTLYHQIPAGWIRGFVNDRELGRQAALIDTLPVFQAVLDRVKRL